MDLTDLHICVSRGNAKMGAIPSISLPPITSCNPKACKLCGKKCYAQRFIRMRKTVRDSYSRNLDIYQNDPEKYWREVNAAVAVTRFFRFGVAGDIINTDYLRNIVTIAKKQHSL